MKQLVINHLAVIAGIVASFVLGFLWYGPIFGEPWMEMVGLTMEDAEAASGNAGMWITNTIASVVAMYALAWLFVQLKVESPMRGALIAFIISFSFVFLSRMTSDMFAQNPYALSWIVGGFDVISLVIGGVILGAWRKYA